MVASGVFPQAGRIAEKTVVHLPELPARRRLPMFGGSKACE